MEVDLTMYSNGQHVLEIVGLTQVVEIARDTVEFFGAGERGGREGEEREKREIGREGSERE